MSAPGDAAAQAPILRLDGISLAFGGVTVLDDVSFDVREGEIRAIIGPNGAGKSSMLNVINGFYHPDDGTITYKGETRTRMRPDQAARQEIYYELQKLQAEKQYDFAVPNWTNTNMFPEWIKNPGPQLAGSVGDLWLKAWIDMSHPSRSAHDWEDDVQ